MSSGVPKMKLASAASRDFLAVRRLKYANSTQKIPGRRCLPPQIQRSMNTLMHKHSLPTSAHHVHKFVVRPLRRCCMAGASLLFAAGTLEVGPSARAGGRGKHRTCELQLVPTMKRRERKASDERSEERASVSERRCDGQRLFLSSKVPSFACFFFEAR